MIPVRPHVRGVFAARNFQKEILPQQRKIIQRITADVLQIGLSEVDVEMVLRKTGLPNNAYLSDAMSRQPHQSFLIDGPKGAGKTTLLVNLRCLLQQIGPNGVSRKEPHAFDLREVKGPFMEYSGRDLAQCQRLAVDGASRYLVHALPLIRPDSMEDHESVMETVFAEMTAQIAGEIDHSKNSASKEAAERRTALKKLKEDLHGDVAKGWYFARKFGVEALLNDSISYEDYIDRRSEQAVVSHQRVNRWKEFVSRYLDTFSSQLLAIFIDDTDVSAELSADLLHTIRMFFCHPRIVVVMAGNLHATRQRLLSRAMADTAQAYRGLRSPQSFTASFWRNFERESLEEYLAKVLPRPYRHFIKPSQLDAAMLLRSPDELATGPSLVDYCSEQMRVRLPEFLKERATTVRTGASDRQLRVSRYERLLDLSQKQNRYHKEAENHIALWLLRNHYIAQISPQTARHINQFRAMIERPNPPIDLDTSARRVMVALFTHPGNHPVLQRQTDYDSDAAAWMNQQEVRTKWRGARWLQLNELRLPIGSPAYELLLFRWDLILARPESAWLSPGFATSMLPEPSGRKIWAPEVWQCEDRDAPSRFLGYPGKGDSKGSPAWQIIDLPNSRVRFRQEMLGLARVFSSPIIPANCLYFKDLRTIPDLAWSWDEKEDDSEYRRFFDQFPVRNVDNMFRLDRYDPRNDYFRDVVLVFASYPLVQAVPSEEFIVGAKPLHEVELSDLHALLDNDSKPAPDTGDARKTGPAVSDTRKALALQELKACSSGLANQLRKALSGHEKAILHAKPKTIHTLSPPKLAFYYAQNSSVSSSSSQQRWFGSGPSGGEKAHDNSNAVENVQKLVSHLFPRYHRILNDVRRSYHAMRIFEGDIQNYSRILKLQREGSQSGNSGTIEFAPWPTPFEHSRNDSYTIVGLAKFRSLLGLALTAPDAVRDADPSSDPGGVFDSRYWAPSLDKEKAPDRMACLVQPFSSSVVEHIERGEPHGDRLIARIGVGCFNHNFYHPGERMPPTDRSELISKAAYRFEFRQNENSEGPFAKRKWTRAGLGTSHPSTDEPESFAALLRELATETAPDENGIKSLRFRPLFDTNDEFDAHLSRMYRSLLLTLWGIGPCLSSLIHLEVMGRHYGSLGDDGLNVKLEAIGRQLDDWEVSLSFGMTAVVALARTLEVNLAKDLKIAQDFNDAKLKADRKAKDNDDLAQLWKRFPKYCAMPDISIAPLGLRLFSEGPAPDVERRFSGIIADTLMRLQLGQYYVIQLRGAFRAMWRSLSPAPDKTPAT